MAEPRALCEYLEWAVYGLTVLVSAVLFSLYIVLRFFLWPADEWESVSFYGENMRHAAPIGLHWAAGIACMVAASAQLLPQIRRRAPAFHRWNGRAALFFALATALGGTLYIILNGTVGGPSMDVAFTIYGALMVGASFKTFETAAARDFQRHRRWALRAFALFTSSAFYRILITPLFAGYGEGDEDDDDTGSADEADGHEPPNDTELLYLNAAAWAFFLPQLLCLEAYFAWERRQEERGERMGALKQSTSLDEALVPPDARGAYGGAAGAE